jgi:hypothetical protein
MVGLPHSDIRTEMRRTRHLVEEGEMPRYDHPGRVRYAVIKARHIVDV